MLTISGISHMLAYFESQPVGDVRGYIRRCSRRFAILLQAAGSSKRLSIGEAVRKVSLGTATQILQTPPSQLEERSCGWRRLGLSTVLSARLTEPDSARPKSGAGLD